MKRAIRLRVEVPEAVFAGLSLKLGRPARLQDVRKYFESICTDEIDFMTAERDEGDLAPVLEASIELVKRTRAKRLSLGLVRGVPTS